MKTIQMLIVFCAFTSQLHAQVSFTLSSTVTANGKPISVTAADINGDGRVDLITANNANNTLSIFTNNGNGGFGIASTNAVGNGPWSVIAANVNLDGRLDLISANSGNSTLSVLTNNGSGGFVLASSLSVGSGPHCVIAADVNGDGKLDLISANFNANSITVLTNNGIGGFVTNGTYTVGVNPISVTAADVNGDGKLDLISANYGGDTVSVLTNNGSGGFVVSGTFNVGHSPRCVVAADVNLDGNVDLITPNVGSSTVSVLTNNGSGWFVIAGTYATGNSPQFLTAADISGDGSVDLISANENGTLSILTNNGSGGFVLAASPDVGVNPNSVVAADVNGDGKPDLISANYDGNTLSVLLNTSPFTTCDPPPAGLVSWWRAEGNANDIIGGNNGSPVGNLGYTNGEVGQAFVFDGNTSYVTVPASSNLNIGASGSGLTIECWIKPNFSGYAIPLVEWDSPSADGLALWEEASQQIFVNMKDSVGNNHIISSANGLINSTNFQHVALTYDKTSGLAQLYYNGSLVATNNLGSFTPQTAYPMNIGRRTAAVTGLNTTYNGLLDELSLYKRALSAAEIAAIYNAGSAGKCFTPTAPAITTQPTNQAVQVGGTATFTVVASGTSPLQYQWGVNNTNIVGATNTVLTLTNVQPSQAGNYSVLVKNIAGSTNSATATLTVSSPTSCDPPPAGLVSWWPGEGNANDIVGGNNGVLMNGASFAAGEVGQAFNLNGGNNYVLVQTQPNSSLNVSFGNGFSFEGWIKPAFIPSTGTQDMILFDYERILGSGSGSDVGLELAIHDATLAGATGGCLYADIKDTLNNDHQITSPTNLLVAGAWQHVGLTYDKATGISAIYINGAMVTQTNLGSFNPATTFTNLLFGARTFFASASSPNNLFAGAMDELSFYSRALSPAEIAAIYSAGSEGKCAPVTTTCTPPPAGIVSWWPGDGSANDIIGGNNGTLQGGIAYAAGEVGQAFSFNDTNAAVFVPASASLNVGTGSGFTLEAWIKPIEVTNITPIFEWNVGDGKTYYGVHFWICPGQPFSASPGPGELYADIVDTNGGNHQLSSNGGATAPGVLQHVALTYDKTTGLATIYCNGVIVAQQNFGSFTPQTSYNLYLGRRPGPDVIVSYAGLLDEPSIYNRALSLAEIAAIYNAGSLGKCAPPPPPPPAHTGTGLAAVTNGFVIGVNLTDGGYGYTKVPLVRFIGGGGSGAQGFAVVSNGVVTGITVTNAGSGYTSAPVVVIEPPFIAQPVLGIAPMSFLSFTNLTGGGTYQLQKFLAWYWTNEPVSFSTSNINFLNYGLMVPGVAGSGDYRLALYPVPAQAFATALLFNGFVVGANVTSGGSGYVTSPAVSIVGGGGTNAVAMAQISGGVVTKIIITDAGIGYTRTPTIQIGQPPAAAVSPTVLPVMRVDASQLAPYDNYQIQFTPDLTAAWANWNGGLFSPTDVTNSQYLFITNDAGFFRLLYVP